jgi:hypothetical protein
MLATTTCTWLRRHAATSVAAAQRFDALSYEQWASALMQQDIRPDGREYPAVISQMELFVASMLTQQNQHLHAAQAKSAHACSAA